MTRAISTTSRRELSSRFPPPPLVRQGVEGTSRHSDRNISLFSVPVLISSTTLVTAIPLREIHVLLVPMEASRCAYNTKQCTSAQLLCADVHCLVFILRYKHIVRLPFKSAASQAKCIYLYQNLRTKVQRCCSNIYFNQQYL